MAFWLALTVTLAAEGYLLRRLRFDLVVIALVLCSTLLCVRYLGYTTFEERNYDGASHLEYIETLARSGRLPSSDACGACGHPPLYYAIGAAWSKLGAGWAPLSTRLQWLSLLAFFGFLVVTLAILRSAGLQPRALRLALALVAFWPSSIINSVRLHNDALASLLMLATIYFVARWDAQGRSTHFYAALVAGGLALLTKATGYTVAATLLVLAALRLCQTALGPRRIKQFLLAVVVLASAAALPAVLRDSRRPRTVCQRVLGSACDGRYVPAVADRPSRFVSFDPVGFVSRVDPLGGEPGPDYFLNRLGRSSLFGVMPLGQDFAGERHQALARWMSGVLLAMVAFFVALLPTLRAPHLRKHRVYAAASVLMLVFLVAFRVRAPNEFHEDFRHIFPILVPFCLGYAALVERARARSRALHAIGLTLAAAMVVLSAAFFGRIV